MATNSSDVTPGTDGTAEQYNNLRKDLVLGINNSGVETDGATVTIDLSNKTKGKIRRVTLGGNRTLALSNETTDQAFILTIIQDGTGNRTVTWWSGIKWPSGIVPTLSTGASRRDSFLFIINGGGAYEGYPLGYNLF